MTTVTVITPAFNSEATIGATLDSVRAQSFTDWECLVVDDGSADDTAELVRAAAQADSRIRLLDNVHGKGPAGARNTGIEAGQGRYIAFLDSDDLWLPHKLDAQLAFMQTTGAALSFTSYELFSSDERRPSRIRVAPAAVDFDQLLDRNHIGCLTAMYDTAQVGKLTMPNLRMRQDWGLWLRIVKASGRPALGMNEVTARLRLRRGSLSRNKLVAVWYNYRLLRDHEGLGVLDATRRVLKSGVMALRGD